MFLKLAWLLFAGYFAHVLWAALTHAQLLSDVQELIFLVIAVLFFVVGILRAKA